MSDVPDWKKTSDAKKVHRSAKRKIVKESFPIARYAFWDPVILIEWMWAEGWMKKSKGINEDGKVVRVIDTEEAKILYEQIRPVALARGFFKLPIDLQVGALEHAKSQSFEEIIGETVDYEDQEEEEEEDEEKEENVYDDIDEPDDELRDEEGLSEHEEESN